MKRSVTVDPRNRGPASADATPLNPLDRSSATPTLSATPNLVPSSGRPLEPAVRGSLERRLGHDFSGIRVHTDVAAAKSAVDMNALAYSTGEHLLFAPGRFDPGTTEGSRLLLHEAAHVAHRAHAPSVMPGIAPANSPAEHLADRVAASPDGVRGFREWGSAWDVHLQRVTTPGTAVLREERLGLAPGEYGPPVGFVEVRTGEEVELKDKSRITGLIALEYTGALAADTKWLQFVWFEMTAVTPAGISRISGSVPTTSGNKPFTTIPGSPSWTVDSASTSNPFYEAGGLAIRNSGSTTMFDRPGGSSAAPFAAAVFRAGVGATSVTFTAHFDTYLVQRNVAAYHVPWSATTTFTAPKGTVVAGPVTYGVGAAGNVAGLPANLKRILDASFPAFKAVK